MKNTVCNSGVFVTEEFVVLGFHSVCKTTIESRFIVRLAPQEGKMGLSFPLGIARFVPAKAKLFGVIFIDQACSVKMTGYLPFFA